VAAELSRDARVALVERETQPGYHATGRSAALFSEIYGNATIRGLSRASRSFFFDPPAGFAEHALVTPRESLFFGAQDEVSALDELQVSLADAPGVQRLSSAEALTRVPVFKPGYLSGALIDRGSADINVGGLLQGYAAQCRRRGVEICLDQTIEHLSRKDGLWQLHLRQGADTRVMHAPVLVNAAGAWGDEIAARAGVKLVGLVPKRRTAVLIDVPDGHPAHDWPAAIHVSESFYFKPDAGLLLLSPADETPSQPCDAQADEYDVAVAVERFEQATGQPVRRLRSRWAGLRTFVADKTPLVGFDPISAGFFWLVGQGGYGIQTAPAMARTAAALASGEALPEDIAAFGVRADDLSPARGGLITA
ncbi:MAG: FAD-binding oxidoreductase, partial [Pseudomonadota bacterium]|nr:FAD-binding oxidoreductase [Pseudomonadota bacterium]